MNPQYVTAGFMKPCQQYDLVADADTLQSICDGANDIEPRVRRSLIAKLGRFRANFEGRSDNTDLMN